MATHSHLQPIGRRASLGRLAALAGAALGLAACERAGEPPAGPAAGTADADKASGSPALLAQVWKTPTCGCCHAWIEHLQNAGFSVQAFDVPNTGGVRAKLGIPNELGSCHTALIGGFAVEGHVPAREIKRLLAEPAASVQDVAGLSVPGMPLGSPGMEMDAKRDKYDVLLVLKNGASRVYQSYV